VGWVLLQRFEAWGLNAEVYERLGHGVHDTQGGPGVLYQNLKHVGQIKHTPFRGNDYAIGPIRYAGFLLCQPNNEVAGDNW